LKEQHRGIPNTWRTSEERQDHFGEEGLDREDKDGAKKNGGHEKGYHQAIT
jgi:hypothetical protein